MALNHKIVEKENKPTIANRIALSPKRIENIFRDVSAKIVSEEFFDVLVFHLKHMLKKNVFEVFLKNPNLFYRSLEKLLGKKGAEVYLSGVIRCLAVEKGKYESIRVDKIIKELKRGRKGSTLEFLIEILL